MNCPGENTLLDFLEGGSGSAASSQVERHVAECPACRALLEDARGELSRTDTESQPLDADPEATRRNRRPTPSETSVATLDALIGKKIGDYQVLERIGAGGMGVVYRGIQPIIGKPVAIKVIRGSGNEDSKLMQRMLLEARAVNAIGHRGIVDIFGFGELPGGRHYVVMEYLQGKPLDLWLRERGPLPLGELLPLLEEILLPLGAAHRAGVVHRDLKPSNLFVVQHSDGARHLKLLDFGLAKRKVHDQSLTRPGLVVGTPAYMAPEQVLGKAVDARTDLYSFGVLVYRMATGARPFEEEDPVGQMKAHVSEPPRPIRQLRVELPVELEQLLLKLLEKDPKDRPGSVEEVQSVLRGLRLPSSEQKSRTELDALHPVPDDRSRTQPDVPLPILDDRSRTPLDVPRTPPRSFGFRGKVGWAAGGLLVLALSGLGWRLQNSGSPEASLKRPEPSPAVEAASEVTPLVAAVEAQPASAPVDAGLPPAKLNEPLAAPTLKPVRPPKRAASTLEDERRQVLNRIQKLRARMSAQRGPNSQPDALSSMFLEKAEADARKAKSSAELRQAERTVQGVERKFLASDG